MKEDEYLNERLDQQLVWYSRKSQQNKKMFMSLRLIEIVSAALIPFIAGMSDAVPYSQWIIGGLGVMIAIAAASTSLFKFQENWVEYRITAERLKHEKYTYIANASPYLSEDKFNLLVNRIESVLSRQNYSWAARSAHNEKAEKKQCEYHGPRE